MALPSMDLMSAFRRSVAGSLGYQPLDAARQPQAQSPLRPGLFNPTAQNIPQPAASSPAPSQGGALTPGNFTPLLPAGHTNPAGGGTAPSAPGTAVPNTPAPAAPAGYLPPGFVPYASSVGLPESNLNVNAQLLASNPALQAYVTSLQSQAGSAHDAALQQLQKIDEARANQYGQWGDPSATHLGDPGYGQFGMQREQLRNQTSARGLAGSGEHLLQDANMRAGFGNQVSNYEQQQSTSAAQLRSALLQQYSQLQAQLAAQALAGGFVLPQAAV